jgi:DNA-binding XRE family transcriptional regulator
MNIGDNNMTLTYYLNKIAKKRKVGIMTVRQEFAKKLNRSEATLYAWETCRRVPVVWELHNLHKLLKQNGFDINVLDLFWRGKQYGKNNTRDIQKIHK